MQLAPNQNGRGLVRAQPQHDPADGEAHQPRKKRGQEEADEINYGERLKCVGHAAQAVRAGGSGAGASPGLADEPNCHLIGVAQAPQQLAEGLARLVESVRAGGQHLPVEAHDVVAALQAGA